MTYEYQGTLHPTGAELVSPGDGWEYAGGFVRQPEDPIGKTCVRGETRPRTWPDEAPPYLLVCWRRPKDVLGESPA